MLKKLISANLFGLLAFLLSLALVMGLLFRLILLDEPLHQKIAGALALIAVLCFFMSCRINAQASRWDQVDYDRKRGAIRADRGSV